MERFNWWVGKTNAYVCFVDEGLDACFSGGGLVQECGVRLVEALE